MAIVDLQTVQEIKEFKIKMGFTTWNSWNLYDPLQRLADNSKVRKKRSNGSSSEENGGEGSAQVPIEGGKDKERGPST